MANKKSPLKILPVLAAVSVGIGAAKAISGFFGRRKAKKKEKKAQKKLKQRMKKYENMPITNPYAGVKNPYAQAKNHYENMENTAEDLEVNTQQAEFERDAAQQNQANVMGAMQEAGGFDAGNIQALVSAGNRAARASSASIGQQEATNKRMKAEQAAANQEAARRGALKNLATRQAEDKAEEDSDSCEELGASIHFE